MECKSCGFELLAGSKFCSKCGEKQERVCFACSKPVGELANFCGYCGNQVSDDKFSEAKVGNLRNNENLSNANVGVRGDIQVQEDTYRLIDMSFVSVCASIGTLSHIAENEGVGAGRPSDIVRFIDKRLDELRSEMISNIKDLRWLNEKQILFMYSVDHNGSGLGSFMKEVDEPRRLYTKKEQLVHDIENRFNDYLDARIDVCIVSIMTWESPDITDFHENDEAGTFCRSINNGIEIYMHDHIIGKVTYSSWDYSGDVDEGFLEDEEDEDWCFNPDWDKSFSAIKLKTTKG